MTPRPRLVGALPQQTAIKLHRLYPSISLRASRVFNAIECDATG